MLLKSLLLLLFLFLVGSAVVAVAYTSPRTPGCELGSMGRPLDH